MKKTFSFFILLLLLLGGALPATAEGVMTIVHDFVFEPFMWMENGNPQGIYYDVLQEALEKRLGISVKYEEYPWKRAQIMVQRGDADGIVTLATKARMEYSVPVSVPLVEAKMGVFTYANHPRMEEMKRIRTVADLRGFTLMTYIGDGWGVQNLGSMDLDLSGSTVKQILLKLDAQRGDIMVNTVEIILYNIKNMGLGDRVVQVPGVYLETLQYKLLIGKTSPFVSRIPEIEKVLTEMQKDGTLDAIYRKYR